MFSLVRQLIRGFSTSNKQAPKPDIIVPGGQIQAKLFTPGPLNTTERVKLAANFDYGSRDPKFLKVVADIRQGLLDLCQVQKGKYECVIVQGSGTFAVESTIGTSIPRTGNNKLLVVINGAYGERIAKMAEIYNIPFTTLKYQDNEIVDPEDVKNALRKHSDVTHVAIIHSETTSGIINPIAEVGKVIKTHNKDIIYIVDAMSSFGTYEILPEKFGIDYLVSSSNKNIQGIPGFAFAIAKTDVLKQTKNNARSLALDMYGQWEGLEKSGQFRFTPPTHVLRVFLEALNEFNEKGGIQGRYSRYSGSQKLLHQKMAELGFKTYIKPEVQGCIITTFLQPTHKNFVFTEFYDFLAEKNLVIYPGKLTVAETFRIGSIGEIYQQDILTLVNEIRNYLQSRGIPTPIVY